jgi:hypothetical protein
MMSKKIQFTLDSLTTEKYFRLAGESAAAQVNEGVEPSVTVSISIGNAAFDQIVYLNGKEIGVCEVLILEETQNE